MCVLSGKYLLAHTIRNRLEIKPVEFPKFKLFRAILTKNCPDSSKTDIMCGIPIIASSSERAKQRKLTYINSTLMRSKVVTCRSKLESERWERGCDRHP